MTRRFAKLDSNNTVTSVIVADSLEWCIENLGGDWAETFKDGSQRFRYAGIGFTFDPGKGTDGAFIPPKPYESWTLNEETCLWDAPTPYPEDGNAYTWDEETTSWVAVPE